MLGFERRTGRHTWTVALVLLALYAAYTVRSTVFIFVLAVFFSYLVSPLVEWLAGHTRGKLSRAACIGVVFVVLLALIGGLLAVAGPSLAEQVSKLIEQVSRWAGDGTALADRIPLPDWLAPYRAKIVAFLQRQFSGDGGAAANVLPAAKQIGVGLLNAAESMLFVVLVPILSFMMIKDAPLMRDRFLDWAKSQRRAHLWSGLTGDLDRLLGKYMRALLLLALATTVAYAVVFSFAGVPFALVLPLIAGALEFVPVAGPLAAAVMTLLVAGLSGYDHLLGLALFMAGYRLFQDYVLSPWLMSGGASVPPLLVLFGLLAGAEIGGIAGVFLSVPILAAARLLVVRIRQELSTGGGAGAARPGLVITTQAAAVQAPGPTVGAAGTAQPAVSAPTRRR